LVLDRDDVDEPAIGRDCLLIARFTTSTTCSATVPVRSGATPALSIRRARRVRVVHRQARLEAIRRDSEGGAAKGLDVADRYDDRQISVGRDMIARCGVVDAHERR
jgi:hypothetical protein